MNTGHIEHLKALLVEHKKMLRALQIQAAKFGIHVPAHVTIEINDLEQKIREIERQIQSLKPISVKDAEDALAQAFGLLDGLSADTEHMTNKFLSYANRAKNGEDKATIRRLMLKDLDLYTRSLFALHDNFGGLIKEFSHLFMEQIGKNQNILHSDKQILCNEIDIMKEKTINAQEAINNLAKSLENASLQYYKVGLDTVIIDKCIDEIKKLVQILGAVSFRFAALSRRLSR